MIPVLGFGVWQVPDGRPTVAAVGRALAAGYRHVDTAQAYGNEGGVGRALRASGIPREDLFVTTKFAPGRRGAEACLEDSLRRLDLDYVDLYLVHDPRGGPLRAWPGMQRAHARGLTRAIGVSNFDAGELSALCAQAETMPLVNQIQLNPFAYRRALVAACERLGVGVVAYSPLTHGTRLGDPIIAAIARKYSRSPAQILLRWGVQRGFVVLPKSVDGDRIVENGAIFDFELHEEDTVQLDALDRTGGTDAAVERKWWSGRERARARARRLRARLGGGLG